LVRRTLVSALDGVNVRASFGPAAEPLVRLAILAGYPQHIAGAAIIGVAAGDKEEIR
jgi:hypothetical protein